MSNKLFHDWRQHVTNHNVVRKHTTEGEEKHEQSHGIETDTSKRSFTDIFIAVFSYLVASADKQIHGVVCHQRHQTEQYYTGDEARFLEGKWEADDAGWE